MPSGNKFNVQETKVYDDENID